MLWLKTCHSTCCLAALCNLGDQAGSSSRCIWQGRLPQQVSDGIYAGRDICALRRLPHCVELLLQG